MEPKTIEPQDVRPGDRICVAWSTQGVDRTMTLTVAEVDLESMVVKNLDGYWASLSAAGRATITLLDRPEPERPVGSHWRDPETGDEYVRTDDSTSVRYRRYRSGDMPDGTLILADSLHHNRIIARLTPLPVFDPAALWPAADSVLHCPVLYTAEIGWVCSRPAGHGGLHAAYHGHEPGAENLRYVWGRP